MENVCMATQAFYLKERKPESILSMGIGYPLPPWLITPEAVMESKLPCPLEAARSIAVRVYCLLYNIVMDLWR
ncbi:hypothetical protein D5086_011376 [Populus alba]|uniref:Uncharacterized protein n=2 Tax=Populus TaxID=3689 RepID=A0ACC4CCL0_POPAL|nr:hypothetical protein NC653_014583 [Populus alba x Populus x berolinensis]